MCVWLCLPTETIHRVFSNRSCAAFPALIRSRASVCLSCQRWGGRRQIRANYENVLHPDWKRVKENPSNPMIPKLLWQERILNQESPITPNVSTTVILWDVRLSWLHNKGSPEEVWEMCAFLSPAVSERPCIPPNSGSLSVSSWLLPPCLAFRVEFGWSVSSRQPWRRFHFKN